jgi:hypothetical protein
MSTLIVLILAANQARSEENILINLEVPKVTPANRPDTQSFFIQSVSDNRAFGDTASSVEVPSWGVEDPSKQTEVTKHRAVARGYVSRGRSEGNVLIVRGDVDSVMKDIVSGALAQLGYWVIENKEDIKPDTIIVDVAINKFWGYFRAAFMGGSIAADIETAITLTKKDKREKKVIQVSAKKSARYPHKAANWELVFNMALKDYMGTAMSVLKQ